ncbi:unnamed protein product [Lymnaea stagnalis]|uniref:Methyltransferase FkbM domain-containing protein n=1 Tax=Lymnaea stagnalis TaxID=6523 RepID=A0AAV2HGH1_LYMST
MRFSPRCRMRALNILKETVAVVAVLVLAYLAVSLMRNHVDRVDNQLQKAQYSAHGGMDLKFLNGIQEKRDLSSLNPDVNIVPSKSQGQLVLQHKDCIDMPGSIRQGLYICVHPVNDDKWVSGTLKAGNLWEANLVQEMLNAFKADPSLQLVDLGCNIGQFSLCAAAVGRHVLSVEMMMTNIQLLQMSLQLSNLTSMVTIVNNAVYSDHRELGVKFMKENIGGNRLNVSNTLDDIDDKAAKVTVKTICMNDLVPLVRNTRVYLKMDIENSEHFALQCADEFFKEVDIKIVQMEWLQRLPEDGKVILAFMNAHGYNMSKSANAHIPVDLTAIPVDIFFLKNSST